MNPWKLTSLVLALVVLFFVGLRVVDDASAGPEAQPNMRTALGYLRQAKNSLQRAVPDKGGHRVKAVELTNAAIDEVQRGMRFDNRHAAE
ncbi:MAG TPA: hypothetical protein VK698_00410 [Kofleriaceae bacterium]|nr:hypothetical protein [Kofleriaceae bacterium]